MRPATVDDLDRVKRDPKEAREIRATYDPVTATTHKLNEHLVVSRITVQTWKVGKYEQKLVTYHVDKELEYYEDSQI